VTDNDRAFGGVGNDVFEATDASGYRISGGVGDDIFYLGAEGRALGGDGDDEFYVGQGGNNLISGGTGKDEFWLLTDDPALISTPNIVTDFTPGVDVIGIMNQGKDIGFANLVRGGNSITLNGHTFATLTGMDTAILTEENFIFV